MGAQFALFEVPDGAIVTAPMPDITRHRNKANPESAAANKVVAPHKSDLRASIVAHLRLHPNRTCKEISEELQMGYTTASARISELKRDGVVGCSGVRRDGAAVLVLCN